MPFRGISGWGFLEIIVIMLLVFGGPIWIVFQWVKYYSRKNNDALGIAKQRYARGEIDKDAYEEIKGTIS
jgi:uncharacterized membrane protein